MHALIHYFTIFLTFDGIAIRGGLKMSNQTQTPRTTATEETAMWKETEDMRANMMVELKISSEIPEGRATTEDESNMSKGTDEMRQAVESLESKTLGFREEAMRQTKDTSDDEVGRVDVVVIGAGWAGLGAANELRRLGVASIRVLEARNYVGGRSLTTYELGSDVPVDLGSAWIHGKINNPVQTLVETSNMPHAFAVETEAVWDQNGCLLDTRLKKKLEAYMRDFMAYMGRRQDSDVKDKSLERVLDDFMKKRNIRDGSVECVGLHWLVDSEISQDYAASLSEQSLFWWDIDEDLVGGDVYLTVPGGGYTALVNKFSSPVMDCVQLRSKVTRIEYGNDIWSKITFLQGPVGDEPKTVLAKCVLVTLPLGVLKAGSVDFSPPLPAYKLKAIENLGTSLQNKCVLYWEGMEEDEIFWPKDIEWIMRIAPEEQGHWTEFYNAYEINGRKPILVGFVAGEYASRIEKQSDESITTEAVLSLKKIFGADSVPQPTHSIVTRWGLDEYSRGAYSFQRVGSTETSRAELAKPVSKQLWFAGEATHRKFPSTTHGALLSGQTAARKIWGVLRTEGKRSSRE